jgi:sugar phosphate isomerase/epimerase
MTQNPGRPVIGSPDELVLHVGTLIAAREPLSVDEVRSLVDDTAAAGFTGVSVWTTHYDKALADGMSPDEFVDYHRERGLSIPSVDAIFECAFTDRAAVVEATGHVVDIAVAIGSPKVIAITMNPEATPAVVATGLRHLCDLAAERGLSVGFEFLPFSVVPTIAAAAQLLDAVDRDNLGLVLDAHHWQRQPGGPDFASLRAIPPDRIQEMQLCDATASPGENPPMETGTARLLPGEGVVDLAMLLHELAEMGATPVVSSEVFSLKLGALGPAEFARLQYQSSRKVLEQHWASA